MKLINTPDRDTHDAVVAEAELKKFLAAYPNSEYVPVAKQYLDSVQDVLAKSYMVIGDQYSVKGNYASPRYREVIEQYPRYSQLDETYFKLAQNDLKTGNVDEAAKNLGEIVRGYPFSKYNEPAKALLEKLGKPLPAVDQQLAAQHQALLKPPEPFSPLKPLIAFAEAIGFKGPPDRFEEAQKIVARDRAAAEEKAASQSGKPGDVMINAVIEKGPDGKAVVNPNVTPPKTDKKDETKKDAKKQDDKTITKK
jgi:tetratricopeptide (TPR) repeat protein